tara:strand:+ start:192 stop:545 length:354 start_codon:yes stop_codon:yes gene_type:complete
MKVGDLVRKNSGKDSGEVGVIIKNVTNSYASGPIVILTVLVDGETKNWYSEYVEVIDERKRMEVGDLVMAVGIEPEVKGIVVEVCDEVVDTVDVLLHNGQMAYDQRLNNWMVVSEKR